ncbi:hypothetical protein WJX84_004733, partial [Apatococcus fuscideae]
AGTTGVTGTSSLADQTAQQSSYSGSAIGTGTSYSATPYGNSNANLRPTSGLAGTRVQDLR